jgi:type I restriction enzyme M protein
MNKQQLAAKIWASANEMRSKIDASEYKDYILGFIFYKFLSEKEEAWLVSQGSEEDDFATLNEENPAVVDFVRKNMGYFIAYEDLYSSWLAKGPDFDVSDVTDALSAFSRLVNPDHKHVFDHIFETLETGLSKLGDTSGARTKAISGLLHLIKDIPMDGRQGYDVLGYIYEYLISNFAANAGKKAGEFYTPHEVSVLMSEIVAEHLKDRAEIEIYDPTSGSGSLLINIGQAVAQRTGNIGRIKYYAQELKENTYNLTRMNLVMRGIQPANIITRNGDTLADDWPFFEDGHPETYQPLFVDACVSNPPYSQRWEAPDGPDPRFDDYGIAPKSKADYAFLLHDLYHLQPDGIMCIVLPHGVLFRGGEEGQIRRNLIEGDKIDAIIGLPANIFFGTGIPTIVMVLKKNRDNSDILVIDASKGFVKEGKNNKLRASDIRRIVDAYEAREDVEHFCRSVSKEEVRDNDYNLNIPRYVDSSEAVEGWDIYATMFGGIPTNEVDALAPYWNAFPGLRNELFESVNEASVRLKTDDVADAIRVCTSVRSYIDEYGNRFSDFGMWLFDELVDETSLVLRDQEEGIIAAEVFHRLEGIPLIDRYDAYQMLDDAWQQIVIDLEIIQTEGFDAVRRVDPNMVVKKKKGKDAEVQDGWTGRVLPFELVQHEMLNDGVVEIGTLEGRLSTIASEVSEILDELTEDEKQEAADALNDNSDAFVSNKIKGVVKTLKADMGVEANEPDSLPSKLERAEALFDEEKTVKKKLKEAKAELENKTKETIESLTDEQTSALLDAKWNKPLVAQMQTLPDVAVEELVAKVRALRDKYATTYADIDAEIQSVETELVGMLGNLTGNEFDMAGINELAKLLGGELR